MPIRKYKSINEMPDERWYPAGSEELFEAIERTWNLAESILPRTFPPGLTKYRSAQALKLNKEQRALKAQAKYWRSQTE